MSWILKGKPRTVLATKALAKEFAEMETLPRDRDLSERRLMIYSRLLNEGKFRPVTWATCFCKETGSTIRVNGRHTSTLLSGLDKIPEFYAMIEHYEADTLEDVANLYSTFDTKTQLRNIHEINMSFASVVPELSPISSRIINVAASGIAYSSYQDAYGKVPVSDRAEAMLDNVEFIVWLDNMIGKGHGQDAKFLIRVPVVAAMFANFDKSRKDATRFWDAVRDQSGSTPKLPDRVLAKWLLMNYVNTGNGASSKVISRRATNKEFFVRCIHGWNAWRKGINTDLKYYSEAKIPAII